MILQPEAFDSWALHDRRSGRRTSSARAASRTCRRTPNGSPTSIPSLTGNLFEITFDGQCVDHRAGSGRIPRPRSAAQRLDRSESRHRAAAPSHRGSCPIPGIANLVDDARRAPRRARRRRRARCARQCRALSGPARGRRVRERLPRERRVGRHRRADVGDDERAGSHARAAAELRLRGAARAAPRPRRRRSTRHASPRAARHVYVVWHQDDGARQLVYLAVSHDSALATFDPPIKVSDNLPAQRDRAQSVDRGAGRPGVRRLAGVREPRQRRRRPHHDGALQRPPAQRRLRRPRRRPGRRRQVDAVDRVRRLAAGRRVGRRARPRARRASRSSTSTSARGLPGGRSFGPAVRVRRGHARCALRSTTTTSGRRRIAAQKKQHLSSPGPTSGATSGTSTPRARSTPASPGSRTCRVDNASTVFERVNERPSVAIDHPATSTSRGRTSARGSPTRTCSTRAASITARRSARTSRSTTRRPASTRTSTRRRTSGRRASPSTRTACSSRGRTTGSATTTSSSRGASTAARRFLARRARRRHRRRHERADAAEPRVRRQGREARLLRRVGRQLERRSRRVRRRAGLSQPTRTLSLARRGKAATGPTPQLARSAARCARGWSRSQVTLLG